MKLFHKSLLLFVLIGCVSLSHAAVWDIDPSHSHVGFRIRHLVTKVNGQFDKFKGSLNFDEKSLKDLSALADIDTSSVNTNEPKRDTHLKTADFFDVEKFPSMTFKSTGVKNLKGSQFQLVGDLTLHGITKPVTLDVEMGGVTQDPWGGTRSGFSAKGMLNRKDYGMVWNKALDNGGFLVGDEVEIDIEVEAVKKK
jgi:polyisoprenoid-binding protein YceI